MSPGNALRSRPAPARTNSISVAQKEDTGAADRSASLLHTSSKKLRLAKGHGAGETGVGSPSPGHKRKFSDEETCYQQQKKNRTCIALVQNDPPHFSVLSLNQLRLLWSRGYSRGVSQRDCESYISSGSLVACPALAGEESPAFGRREWIYGRVVTEDEAGLQGSGRSCRFCADSGSFTANASCID